MPIYKYTASKGSSGKEIKGIIEALNITTARTLLRRQGFYLRSIKEDQEKRERELFPGLAKLLYRVPRRVISLFARRLGTLLEAGLPLDRSLNNILQQTENEHLKKALITIRADVTEGGLLSDSFKKHPTLFPPIYYHLVAIGEKTGTYEKSLIRLADLEDANEKLRSKVVSASIYPVIMLFLLGGIMSFLLTVVFPQIKKLFTELNAKLPLITRIIIAISDTLSSSWMFLIIGGAVGIFYLFYNWKSKSPGKEKWEKFILRLPVIGNLNRKVLIARFTRNLGIMLLSRVPLIMALQVVARLVDHNIFSKEISIVIERIKEGAKLSESFKDSQILNLMVLGMLSAGESSDQVPQMINKVAEVMEVDVETSIDRASTLLEPIMIVVMGLMIVIIMSAILLPMYDLTNQLQY